jgi:hypothetical protein
MRMFALHRRGAAWAHASRFQSPVAGEVTGAFAPDSEHAEAAERKGAVPAKPPEPAMPLQRRPRLR